MKTRILPISLFLLVFGIILAYGSPAFAQAGGPVTVLRLSGTWPEQAHSVAFSPDSKLLAAGGTSGIYLFDTSKPASPSYIQTDSWAHSVAFIPGTGELAAGLFDHTVKIWTMQDIHRVRGLTEPQDWVRSISLSRDGRLVAAASDDNAIHVWAIDSGSMVLTLRENIAGIRAVALSPDGRLVAGGMSDKTVRIWTVPEGRLLYTLTGHGDWVREVVFSPDGRILASSGFDMTVRLWDVSSGQLLHALRGHTSSVLGLSFSPDGKILASSSTDTTIRLWRVSDGAPLQVLRGHTGFVYSVAFSPDGKTLASGASDNTVRLWNVAAWLRMPAPPVASGPIESTTKDCRLCHHRQGAMAPPRVVELSCENCHAGGIGQSWCAGFQRFPDAGPMDIAYHPVDQSSGVPVGTQALGVSIASPGNGETLYVRGDFMAPEVIAGKVFAADPASLRNVELHLDITAGGHPTASLIAAPASDGTFHFNTAINPNSPPPLLSKPGTRQCLVCHGDYQPEAGLPVGVVRLVVTATTLDGQRATDERWIRVDSSRSAFILVQAVDSQSGQPVPGLSVDAFTLLYHWRGRYGNVVTGADGKAQLSLEDSSQVPLPYRLSIPPQVVNGVLYSSQPMERTLQPGIAQSEPVLLQASAQPGELTGKVSGGSPLPSATGVKIWAVQQPVGPAFQALASPQGVFSFEGLPVGSYWVTPDLPELAQQSLFAVPRQVDLLEAPQTSVAIPLSRARSVVGSVADDRGFPVPFAWLQFNGRGSACAIDAASGQFVLSGLPEGAAFVTVNAPGYYSQSQHIPAGQTSLAFRLVPDSGSRRMTWGRGAVSIPPQSGASISGSRITLEHGWIWGDGGGRQPLTIDAGNAEIRLDTGEFALERAAGQTDWFYLRQGHAAVHLAGKPVPVELASGEMLALEPGAAPLSMDETVVLSLHPPLTESPIPERLQPTFAAHLQDSLEKAGISALQTITFITYFLSLVALIALPIFVLFWIKRRRKAPIH